MKKGKLLRSNFVGPSFCAGLFGLLLIAIFCPAVGVGAHAEDAGATGDEANAPVAQSNEAVAQSNEGVSPRATTKLSISFVNNPTTASANVTAGTVGYTSVQMQIGAENVDATTGAQLYVQAASGSSASLVNENDASQTVAPLSPSASVKGSEIGTNKWGYAIGSGGLSTDAQLSQLSYKGISESGNTTNPAMNTLSGDTLNGTHTLAFGANINRTAGHYKTNVLVSLAAGTGEVVTIPGLGFGPGEISGLGNLKITKMQEMTNAVCSLSDIGSEGRLIDERDGKAYWVAKLADGNCWMTQNLDLDLSTGRTLTSTDSDVVNWTPANSDENTIPNTRALSTSNWPTSGTPIRSYDPGWYVYINPTNMSNSCGDANGLKNCTSKGWRLVTQDGTDYDAHYLVGNYYSWMAATAGQSSNLTTTREGGEAPNSICPKGWKMPSKSRSGSFEELFASYGSNTSGFAYGGVDVRTKPIYLVPTGYISNGKLNSAGGSGGYWMSLISETKGHTLDMGGPSSIAFSNSPIYYGYTVRCVAR